jgi:hypothetical protein
VFVTVLVHLYYSKSFLKDTAAIMSIEGQLFVEESREGGTAFWKVGRMQVKKDLFDLMVPSNLSPPRFGHKFLPMMIQISTVIGDGTFSWKVEGCSVIRTRRSPSNPIVLSYIL